MLILNIGLDTVHGGKLDPRAAFIAIAGKAPGAVWCGVHESDSESTLVLAVDSLTPASVHRLAEHLAQDCIAVYDSRLDHGRLIGPNSAAWGGFDATRFIMPDGSWLQETQS